MVLQYTGNAQIYYKYNNDDVYTEENEDDANDDARRLKTLATVDIELEVKSISDYYLCRFCVLRQRLTLYTIN